MTTALAQGKINLVFQVGALSNGYHEVRSIYQAIDLREEVTVSTADSWQVEVFGDVPNLELVPTDETNIVVKAAKALALQVGITNPQPMKFEIQKQIPVAGGMAGGSADAAAALIALNEHWCLGLDAEQLSFVGASIGADVPFALLGGTALGRGTGTELEVLKPVQTLHVLLVFSNFPLSTKEVFARFDELFPHGDALDEDLQLRYVDILGANSLEPAALSLRPELQEIIDLDLGIPGGFLSGSGPTVWFASTDSDAAHKAQQTANELGLQTVLTSTSNLGARLR